MRGGVTFSSLEWRYPRLTSVFRCLKEVSLYYSPLWNYFSWSIQHYSIYLNETLEKTCWWPTRFLQKKIIQLYQFKNFNISLRETNVNHLFLPTLTLLLKNVRKRVSGPKVHPFALFKTQKPENHTKQHSLRFNVQRFFRCFLLFQWKVSEIRGRAWRSRPETLALWMYHLSLRKLCLRSIQPQLATLYYWAACGTAQL